MSKFIDKLKHLSQEAPEPVGFRTRQPALPKPRIQIAARISNFGNPPGDFSSVADALLTYFGSGGVSPKEMAEVAGNVPWGIWENQKPGRLSGIAKTGCDFIVFTLQESLAVVENSEIGKILAVKPSLYEEFLKMVSVPPVDGRSRWLSHSLMASLLRAVNELPVDAVLVDAGLHRENASPLPLTWQHLLLFQLFAKSLTKPLLASVPANVTGGELQALWTAGIDCVVIEAATPENIKTVRQVIDSLTFPLPRRREKAGALLPRIAPEPHHAVEEEEEEE